MIHLLITLVIFCSSAGAALSKFGKNPVHRAERKHIKPLVLDKEV